MKIQKGIVKYKDRDDIVCTYGVTDSGESFYFLDEGRKLANGNIIASTELVEAVDPMFKAKRVGVIDSVGNVVIPFCHRAIRSVNDDILLAEVAQPVTPSVIEANRIKSDPTLATKLVSTPALIKDRLNSKMSSEGRYIFNDQFSEATVYDINGNNLINGENYSFIAMDGGKLLFSKNVADSDIVEYSLLPPEVQSNVAYEESTNDINVNNVEVPTNVVENALQNVATAEESIPAVPVDEVAPEEVVSDVEVPVEEAVPQVAVDEVAPEEVVSDAEVPVEETVPQVAVDEVAPEEVVSNVEVPVEESIPEVAVDEVAPEEVVSNVEVPVEESIPEVAVDEVAPEEVASDAEVPVEEAIPEVAVDEVAPEEVVSNVEVPVEEAIPEVDADLSNDNVEEDSKENNIMDAIESIISSKDYANDNIIPSVEEDVDYSVNDDSIVKDTLPIDEEENEEIPFSNIVMDDSDSSDIGHVIDIPEDVDTDNEIDDADNDDDNYDFDDKVEDTPIDDMFYKNTSTYEEAEDEDKLYKDSSVRRSDIEEVEEYEGHYDNMRYVGSNNSIMSDVAKSMTKLMRQNRELKNEVASTKEKLEKVTTSRRNIADKSNMQEKKIEALNTKIRNLENALSKLEIKNESLENKTRDQEKVINSQAHELNALRPQLQGKEDLMKVLADAQALLGEEESYSYNEDSYYRRNA